MSIPNRTIGKYFRCLESKRDISEPFIFVRIYENKFRVLFVLIDQLAVVFLLKSIKCCSSINIGFVI